MNVSDARIQANRANSARSTGPKSEEGKARSRANSYKHGMTGAGVVMTEEDSAEVARLSSSYQAEMNARGDVGKTLAHRMAVMTVRMDRCVEHEAAALTDRVRQARDDFEAPEGLDAAEVERRRTLAGRRALFDPSKEASLARKYEAAAERCFFRSLKELRLLNRKPSEPTIAGRIAEDEASLARLGSFLKAKTPAPAKAVPTPAKPVPAPSKPTPAEWDPFAPAHTDIPITIGRAR